MCIAPCCCTRLLETLDGFFVVRGGVIGEGIATQAAGQLDGGLLEQRVQGLRLLGGQAAGGAGQHQGAEVYDRAHAKHAAEQKQLEQIALGENDRTWVLKSLIQKGCEFI